MERLNYTCPKCSNATCEAGEFRASGGGISAFFDLQNKRFSTVTCTRCRYTEIYQTELSSLSKILDLFGS